MVALIPPQTVLTPSGAANDLQTHGLDALGLTVPNLSPAWAANPPGTYAQASLSLQLTGLRAPFRAIREFVTAPSDFSGPDGRPMTGAAAVLRLHPEAARRLSLLVANRLGTAPPIHPVPVAMVVQGITLPDPVPVPEWFYCGDPVDTPGAVTVTFHDNRGLAICPIAVASLFADLLSWRPALYVANGPAQTVGDPGGLTAITMLATGVLAHVVDPHGWAYAPTRDIARLRLLDSGNAQVQSIDDTALVTIGTNQGIGRSDADNTADGTNLPARWGWATASTLARAKLVPPALSVTLGRQFLRVMAVDLDWHLVGNRSAAAVASIPADDQSTPAFLLPKVRDPVPNFAYLSDPQEVLGAAAAMSAGFGGQASTFAIAVSPIMDAQMAAPAQPGTNGHWPAFPPAAAPGAISSATNPRSGLVATRRALADGAGADRDVIVTVKADTVPAGAHVRIFPRRFQEIMAISDQPSFVRPDGGSALASAGQDTKVLVVNPFGLNPGDVWPNPANLAMDIVVTDRMGQRRLFSQTTVTVADGPESFAGKAPNFGGAPLLGAPGLQAVLDGLATRGVAAAPLFGVPRTTPLPAAGGPVVGFIRALASETQPRQGPRLPTMMRFDLLLVTGTNAAASTPLAWNAVLTGARLTNEARSFRPDLGNPGNPAGPDILATGVRCDGWLARDLALHAIKRAQPIVPLGGRYGRLGGGDGWKQLEPAAGRYHRHRRRGDAGDRCRDLRHAGTVDRPGAGATARRQRSGPGQQRHQRPRPAECPGERRQCQRDRAACATGDRDQQARAA